MAKNNNNQTGISRREFMELTGAAGIGSVLSPLMISDAWAHDIETHSFSFTWHGPIHTKTVNGRLVSTRAYNEAFHKNAVAASIPEYVYSKSRIKYPMVRILTWTVLVSSGYSVSCVETGCNCKLLPNI